MIWKTVWRKRTMEVQRHRERYKGGGEEEDERTDEGMNEGKVKENDQGVEDKEVESRQSWAEEENRAIFVLATPSTTGPT
jgi:hypothetical protein